MVKLIRRILALIPAVVVQALWFYALIRWMSKYAAVINLALSLCAVILVLFIMTSQHEEAYKTLWLLVILGLPIAGTVLYLCVGNHRMARPLQRKLKNAAPALPQADCTATYQALERENPRMAQTFRYIQNLTGYPPYPNESAEYYPEGVALYEAMLRELETAEKYIFVEYFIIESGTMWDSMVEIMERKVARGVDVRVIYDDLGSISSYSSRNVKALRKKGIRCISFNPMVILTSSLNYRDHRKMLLIDGRVVFSGGVNLADRYINLEHKFGHWKDTGFRLTGRAVENYMTMFARFWNAFSHDPLPEELLELPQDAPEPTGEDGFVLSYCDSPLCWEASSNELYIELLSQAKDYIWFYTPYLMLGDALLNALIRTARRGVDVRIVTPGVPDTPIVQRMSRSYYGVLLEAGVRIFEYFPGFLHAKGCLSDDKVGTLGTVNLDYRSLYLHFENNSLFYHAPLLQDVKQDFLDTQSQSREWTSADAHKNFFSWLLDGVLRIFAPLC